MAVIDQVLGAVEAVVDDVPLSVEAQENVLFFL